MLFDGDGLCVCIFSLSLHFGSLFLFNLAFEIETNQLLCPAIYFFFVYVYTSYVCHY